MPTLDRAVYARWYGPTKGDRIRLADTDLWVEVEEDDNPLGDELLGGCGKSARDGMLVGNGRESKLDLIVTNVVVLDPTMGVRKTNIGVKDGRIAGLGSAGPSGSGASLEVDAHTAIITGEGLIATPGIVDSHVHLSSPEVAPSALAGGVTTIVGMGIGGVWDVGANPAYNLHTLIEAWREIPVNAAFLARGSSTSSSLLESAVEAGAGGYKVHEDWGASPAAIDTCLTVAEAADLPVALHTDTLNESGFLRDTIAATAGRTVHAYHVEGGGGHPDLLEILNVGHVLASSTTPTIPYTVHTVAELFPMTMTVHRLNSDLAGDHDVARSRIRAHAIAAENHLHDRGAISIVNSDAMGMGRIAETFRRTCQLASVLAVQADEHGPDRSSNERVLRFLAKVTLNPAIAHGIAHEVGSLASGRLADIVLWSPGWFGTKPELVIKSGFVAWGVTGSGSGSTRLTQPRAYAPYFGGMGGAPARLSQVYVAGTTLESSATAASLPPGVSYAAVRQARGLTRADMVRNSVVPQVVVPTDGSEVLVDGERIGIPPADRLPLTRAHHLG